MILECRKRRRAIFAMAQPHLQVPRIERLRSVITAISRSPSADAVATRALLETLPPLSTGCAPAVFRTPVIAPALLDHKASAPSPPAEPPVCAFFVDRACFRLRRPSSPPDAFANPLKSSPPPSRPECAECASVYYMVYVQGKHIEKLERVFQELKSDLEQYKLSLGD